MKLPDQALRAPARAGWSGASAIGVVPIGPALLACAGLAAWAVFPDDLGLLARLVALALFVMSLQLVTGLAGVATLGHAVVYGAGAYAAGYACMTGTVTAPLPLLAIGGLAGGVAGFATGAILLRARGLSQLVLSIAVVQLAQEAANKARGITGGSDGLTGIEPGPLFGHPFDLQSHTGYAMGLGVLVLVFAVVTVLARSPFGLTCRAIQADEGRVRAMGVPAGRVLLILFAISGAVAGLGGAVSALSAGVVGLDSVGFELSAEGLVMAVLGGLRSPAGAVVGAAFYTLLEHQVSAASPYHWLIVVGAVLIVTVRILPAGLLSARLPFRRARG